jgi:hypothetical protein
MSVIKLSPAEQRLLDIIPTDGSRVSTKDLLPRFYDGQDMPAYGQVVIGNHLRSLTAKVKRTRKLPRVRKSKRRGPHPIEVWIENR